ncbi:CEL4a mannanase [Mycena rebaudengoi]|nr:CEL4a mannanase [Mycena rebaudengoi]
MIRVSLLIFALSLGSVLATVPVWSQCGGQNYSGDTVCETGTVCTVLNPFYFQCIPGTATTTVTPTTTRSTTVSPTTTSAPSTVTGFVKTSGTRFTVNGSKYTVVGSNGYWLPLAGYSKTDVDKAFADIAASGATTVRTWGFNEVTSANGVYFQLWNGKTPTVNTGANGLGALDLAIASAKAHGLRLIIALTNNWSDFGGMDAAFKAYVKTVVTRYVNEPGIMAWELANEPRCKGSNTGTSAACTPATITAWASNLSAFIKTIDSNHLVGIGDEGFYNQPGSADYPYQGGEGIDFAANLKISTIDFGTVHLGWGEGAAPESWGVKWITDHAASQNATNKPVILEEFGIPDTSRNTIYATWLSTIVNSGLAGDLIWQAGSVLTNGQTANDGYTIYPTDPVYALLKSHSAALKPRG